MRGSVYLVCTVYEVIAEAGYELSDLRSKQILEEQVSSAIIHSNSHTMIDCGVKSDCSIFFLL